MSFGADSDYWSFADTNNKLISSSSTPNKTEGQAQDSNGDVAASTLHDSVSDISVQYEHCHDTALVLYDTTSAVDFRVGKVIGGYVITSLEVASENTARPKLTINGQSTSETDGDVQKYDPTDLEIAGTRKATAVGATVAANNKLLSSTTTLSATVAKGLDSDGNECWLDVHAGRIEAVNNFVGVSVAPSATADTNWTLSGGPSNEQENTAYATGSVTVFKNMTKM